MSGIWRWTIRVSAFLRKELVAVIRQPVLVVSLVLGPFVVLLLFGAGLEEEDPPLRTAFVAPDDDWTAAEVREYAQTQRARLEVIGITDDRAATLAQLRRGELELVVVFPEGAVETVRANQRAQITLYHDELDPVETQAIELFTRTAVDQINQRILSAVVADTQAEAADVHERIADARARNQALLQATERADRAESREQQRLLSDDVGGIAAALAPAVAVLSGDDYSGGSELAAALDAVTGRADDLAEDDDPAPEEIAALDTDLARLDDGLAEFRSMDPDVMVTPFQGETESIARDVTLSDFYAPAVVALLLQHMVITFLGLSLVREQELGTVDLFRVAPLAPVETLVGKALAYLLLGWIVAAMLIALLVAGLSVPMSGSWLALAAGVTGLLLASIGVGFVLALVARSDSQAVQYAMLFLLASVFFSGFLLSLERFQPLLRPVSWILPVTWATRLLRDVMLRGQSGVLEPLAALLALAAVGLTAGLLLLRRRLRQG